MLLRRRYLYRIFIVFCFFSIVCAEDTGKAVQEKQSTNTTEGDYTLLNINCISTYLRNNGSFNRNPITGNAGFEWPKGSGKTAIYASGLWLGGKALDTVRVALAEYSYEFAAGPWHTDTASPLNKMYKISLGNIATSVDDYQHWPFDQGAPAVRTVDNTADSLDAEGKRIPQCLGDETVFCVFHDADPNTHIIMHTPPLGVEIQLTAWAYNRSTVLGSTIFYRWRIINKNNYGIDSMYVGIWCDADIGGFGSYDLNGCDSTLSLGFTYNGYSESDYTPGPAVGFKLLQGPMVSGASSDYATLEDGHLYSGKKLLPMTSYVPYGKSNSDLGQPQSGREVFNYLRGTTRTGYSILDLRGRPTSFMYSGDPTQPFDSSSNWLDPYTPNDRHFLMASGPFIMAAGDTQTIVAANVIVQGKSNTNSVASLKDTATSIQTYFNLNTKVDHTTTDDFAGPCILNQNYPNPFNPSTTIRFFLSRRTMVTLKIYDVLGRELATLVNTELPAGAYIKTWNAFHFSDGVYYCRMQTGSNTQTKKLLLLK